jgi:arsenate reductase
VSARPLRVLFLCTGNSARSILAEAIRNALADGKAQGLSAGSHPKGRVDPLALELLRRRGLQVAGLRSKGWEEFARPSTAPLDHVVTVCDNAAGEQCPVWPGRPATEHWSIPDPAAVRGPEDGRRRAFETAFADLESRIRDLLERLAVGRSSAETR